MNVLVPTVLACLSLAAAQAQDERIIRDGKINGVVVRFAVDTGTSVPLMLYSTTCDRLHLKVNLPATNAVLGPGETPLGWTEKQRLDFGFTNMEAIFAVVEMPPYLKSGEDGMLGWPAFSGNLFSLDCLNHTLHFFTNAPPDLTGWTRCIILTNTDDLTVALPGKNGRSEVLALDTGSTYGIKLGPQQWQTWRTAHAHRPVTFEAYFTPNPGLVVAEEGWAENINLGGLNLTDVPVMPANSSDAALHESPSGTFLATLGFEALKRLDVVVDGKQGVVWLRPKKSTPTPYTHNRIGAVFVPETAQGEDLVAHVAAGGPAYQAGIRDGDRLQSIGQLDCTRWRTDPDVLPLSRFFSGKAGTRLNLIVKHGDTFLKTTVTLQNILPPDPQPGDKTVR